MPPLPVTVTVLSVVPFTACLVVSVAVPPGAIEAIGLPAMVPSLSSTTVTLCTVVVPGFVIVYVYVTSAPVEPVPPLVVVSAETWRPPNTSPWFTGCEQSVLKVTVSSSVPLASKICTAVLAASVVFPGTLAALTSTSSPMSTLAGLPVSSQTVPPPSVTRSRTGEAVGLFTGCVHFTESLACELPIAAHPPPLYCRLSTVILPRHPVAAGAGRSWLHSPPTVPPQVSVPSVGSFRPTRVHSGDGAPLIPVVLSGLDASKHIGSQSARFVEGFNRHEQLVWRISDTPLMVAVVVDPSRDCPCAVASMVKPFSLAVV